MAMLKQEISKLPVRQVTGLNPPNFIIYISKLPVRQVTVCWRRLVRIQISKLPVRQVTQRLLSRPR